MGKEIYIFYVFFNIFTGIWVGYLVGNMHDSDKMEFRWLKYISLWILFFISLYIIKIAGKEVGDAGEIFSAIALISSFSISFLLKKNNK